MFADREAESRAPREAEVVRALDPERVQDGDGVRDPRPERVRLDVVRLVAAPLAAMVAVDQAEVALERLGEGRRLRVRDRVREARIDEDRWSVPAGVIEERADLVDRVGRVRQATNVHERSTGR